AVQQVVVPDGATRLFLGSMDGYGWYNNFGSFSVQVNALAPEPGRAGWTIYLDQNQNGGRDAGQRFPVTDGNGDYAFADLAPGAYVVAEQPQSGWVQTAPAGRTYSRSVTAGEIAGGLDFGNRTTADAGPNHAPAFASTPPTTATVGRLFSYQAV